jgi:WD40 repeat protein
MSVLLLVLALSLTACSLGGEANYKPPLLPIVFTLQSDGTVSVSGDASVTTPVGTFSVAAGGYNSLGPAAPADKMVLIIRHLKGGGAVDTVFYVADNDALSITTDGLTQITLTLHRVFIDAAKSVVKSITLKDDTPLIYTVGGFDFFNAFGGGLVWSPSGEFFAISAGTTTPAVVDAATVKDKQSLYQRNPLNVPYLQAIDWSPDGKHVAVAEAYGGSIYTFDPSTGLEETQFSSLAGSNDPVKSIRWSPDSGAIAAAVTKIDTVKNTLTDVVNIYDVATGKVTTSHLGFVSSLRCAWSTDGKYMLLLTTDAGNIVWDVPMDKTAYTLADLGIPCLSPTGARIAYLEDNGDVRIVDAFSEQHAAVFKGHDIEGDTLSWSPDGTRLMSVRQVDDKNKVGPSVEIWDAQTGNTIVTYRYPYQTIQDNGQTYGYGITDAQWSPNGYKVAILFTNKVAIQAAAP